MDIIRTIDLWTEPSSNNIECFSGAFIDGFENNSIPFDEYKIIKNCNCIISTNRDFLNIRNKHNSIVFYKDDVPVRLMVINQETDINNCINIALSQYINNLKLRDIYNNYSIEGTVVDLKETAINNDSDSSKEIDVGSCDRPGLLKCMLEGSYTESDTDYGKSNSDTDYTLTSDFSIEYKLITDKEYFKINHNVAFINKNMTRVIPLQDNSSLDIKMIYEEFGSKEKKYNKKKGGLN